MFEQKLIYFLVPFVLLQILFTPGIILISKLKIKLNLFSIILLSLVCSFFTNYLVVSILLIFGFYNTFSAWTFLIIINIYFFLNIDQIKLYLSLSYKNSFQKFNEIINSDRVLSLTCVIVSLLVVGVFIQNFFSEIKNVNFGYLRIFENQDSVQMYDMWAKEYARGNFPSTAFLRPHLFPVNISLIYVLFDSIFFEFIALFIFSVFSIYFIFVGLSLSIIKKNLLFLPISIFAVNILFNNTFGQAFSGYLEVPMSLFLMIFIISLYEFSHLNIDHKNSLIVIFVTFLTTFLIKEWVWLNLLFVALYFLFSRKFFNKKVSLKLKVYFFILFFIFITPFYLFQLLNYNLFENILFLINQLSFDEDLHIRAGSNPMVLDTNTRFIYALKTFPSILILPSISILIYNFKDKILNIFILSFFSQIIFWFLFASNEFRYLYFQFFFFILFGYYNFINFLYLNILKIKAKISLKKSVLLFLSIWAVFILFYNKTLSKKEIEFMIFEKKTTLNFDRKLDKEINEYFYNYFLDEKNLNNKIFSNYRYHYIKNIPIFIDVFEYKKTINIDNIDNYKFKYFLFYKNCNISLNDKFFVIKFFEDNTCFIEKN